MGSGASAAPGPPSRQGLVELALVAAFLAVAAVGAVAVFGDEIRAACGVRPAHEQAHPLPQPPAPETAPPPR